MKELLASTHRLLVKKKLTVAVAESCTGGKLSELLTRLSGSSKFFILGIITYSNKAKQEILKIPYRLISNEGAVSKEVAQAMAKSVRILAKSDLAAAITGIAGPSGAVTHKPVGTVFIAVESKTKKICRKFRFNGQRSVVRKKACRKALQLLSKLI